MADIVIFYELPERELNNANLLKAEFERRGYTVDIKDYWNYHELIFPIKYKPKLVITQSGYDNGSLERFLLRFKPRIDKMLNLRYEQVIAKNILNSSAHYPSENMKKLSHICWSEYIKEGMLNQDIPEKKLPVTGDIKTDFSNKLFDSFYKTKDELSEEFGLDKNKEWILFISSFTFNGNESKNRLLNLNNNLDDAKYLQKWDIDSKKIMVEWIRKFLKNHPEKEFIYRPHPVEHNVVDEDLNILSLDKDFSNFHYINKYAIQEWVRPSDYLNTVISTSIIDVYLLNKQCNVLRPIPLDEGFDNPLLINANFISSFEDFEKYNLRKYDDEFPVSDETIQKYYYFGDKLAYELICDYAEEMINDDYFVEDFYHMNPILMRLKFILKKSISMPKIIPTVIKSAFSNTSSLHDEDIKWIYDKNAKKINDIVKNR